MIELMLSTLAEFESIREDDKKITGLRMTIVN